MEVFKKYLDRLPKIGLDYSIETLEEGDVIYEMIGHSGDFGSIDVVKIAEGIKGGISIYQVRRHPDCESEYRPGEYGVMEIPVDFKHLFYYMRESTDKMLPSMNDLGYSILAKDRKKLRLAIQRGDKIIRYKLVKKDGQEFEILT